METKIEIKTERLTLRPVQLGDETEIHEYAGDKEITMMFWLPNDTFEETADFGEDLDYEDIEGAAEWLLKN